MSQNKIGIIGCGWLGLPLAKELISNNHKVKGSTTTEEKLKILVRLLNATGEKYLIHVGDKTFTLSEDFIEKLLSPEGIVVGDGSDAEVIEYINDYSEFRIEKVVKKGDYTLGKEVDICEKNFGTFECIKHNMLPNDITIVLKKLD